MTEFINKIIEGDCLEVMKTMPSNCVDTVITDPPYGLSQQPDIAEVMRHWLAGDKYNHKSGGFMGKSWDSFVPNPDVWKEVLRVLKPGGHALVFAGTRTQDLMSISLRFAGFEIRDTMMWMYGSGFPKSLDISKAITKIYKINEYREKVILDITKPSSEQAKQFEGYGTALKPAYEPIIVAMKPVDGNFAGNALKHGVAGLNIDGGRISSVEKNPSIDRKKSKPPINNVWEDKRSPESYAKERPSEDLGRFPANVVLQHHRECKMVGYKKVKSSTLLKKHNLKELENIAMSGKNYARNPRKDYAPDGKETVENWSCHPLCPIKILEEQSGELKSGGGNSYFDSSTKGDNSFWNSSVGGSSRFFYTAKTHTNERNIGIKDGINNHPTVKPLELLRYLVKLTRTPTGGVVLDPFLGSGTTAMACVYEGREYIGIEKEKEYVEIAMQRVQWVREHGIYKADSKIKIKKT